MAENGRSSAGGGGRPVKALKPHDETNEPTDEMIASVVTQVDELDVAAVRVLHRGRAYR